MHSENIIYKNEMNEKTTKFLDKFVKRVKGNPPGVCPIAVQLSFLQSARSQTCGKCVPCRDGLEQVENMMRSILDGKADMDTFNNMVSLAEMIQDTADCAIGYEAANIVLQSVELFRDSWRSTAIYCLRLGQLQQGSSAFSATEVPRRFSAKPATFPLHESPLRGVPGRRPYNRESDHIRSRPPEGPTAALSEAHGPRTG